MPPQIHSRPRSFGIVPVFFKDGEPLFLVLRAYRHWDFPKGRPNAGERALQTARRELEEETTISDVSFPWGERFVETEPYNGGKVARYYLGEVSSRRCSLPFSAELGRPEHQEFRWVSAHEARQLLIPRVRRVLEWAVAAISGSADKAS